MSDERKELISRWKAHLEDCVRDGDMEGAKLIRNIIRDLKDVSGSRIQNKN